MANPISDQHQQYINHYMHLGLLPFFTGALGAWVFPQYQDPLHQFFFFYSSLILVFLSGVIWAVALYSQLEHRLRHSHMAIVLSLWPVACYFMPNLISISMMLLGFLVLLFWEKCFINIAYPTWYQDLRHKITFIVVACHMLTIFNIMNPYQALN